MCKLIEKANILPSQALRYLNILVEKSKIISSHLEIAEDAFKKYGDPATKNELIDYFIQNSEMIAETQVE